MLPILILIIEFVILALFKSTGTTDVGNFIASVLILVHVFFLIVSLYQDKRIKRYSKTLIIAFVIRLVFVYLDVLAYPYVVLPNGHGDELIFYRNAINYAETGYTFRGFFPEVMGTLFRFIGYNELYAHYVNMLFAIFALIYLIRSLEELDIDAIVKMRAFRFACLLPNSAILSALFMRESVIYMFLSLSLYCFIRWTKQKKEKYYFLAAGFVFPAAAFHSGTIAVLVGYIIIRLFYDNKKEQVNIKATNIILTLIVAILAVLLINQSNGQFTGKFGDLDSLQDIANTNTAGDSSYARYVGNSNNPVNLLLFTPLRIFFFLFSPVPWMWRGAADIIAFCFSSLFYLLVIWDTVKFLKSHQKKNRVTVIAFLIIALAAVFVFAWGTSNAGTATRHRDKMLILFTILWALSVDGLKTSDSMEGHKRRKHRKRFA